MRPLTLTRQHQLWFNEFNQEVERSRREYEAHPTIRWCWETGCDEPAGLSLRGKLTTRCDFHLERRRQEARRYAARKAATS